MELLNAVLIVTKCENAEQLKNLSAERKKKLADSLEERVPSGLASIEEWNELLMIFMNAPPEKENKIAKKKLLSYLRGEIHKESLVTAGKINGGNLRKSNRKRAKKLGLQHRHNTK